MKMRLLMKMNINLRTLPAAAFDVFTMPAVLLPTAPDPPVPAIPGGGEIPGAMEEGAAAALLTVTVTNCVMNCARGVTVTVGGAPVPNTVIVTNDNCRPLLPLVFIQYQRDTCRTSQHF